MTLERVGGKHLSKKRCWKLGLGGLGM